MFETTGQAQRKTNGTNGHAKHVSHGEVLPQDHTLAQEDKILRSMSLYHANGVLRSQMTNADTRVARAKSQVVELPRSTPKVPSHVYEAQFDVGGFVRSHSKGRKEGKDLKTGKGNSSKPKARFSQIAVASSMYNDSDQDI